MNEIIATTVKERLSDAAVRSVDVTPDADSDGEPILRVTVVLGVDEAKLDSARMAGLVRHVRSRLEEVDARAFPVISFVSIGDAVKRKREIA